MKTLGVGIIGMGGFAGVHHDIIAKLEAAGEFRLVCACDPRMDTFAARQTALRFAERGVRLFTDYVDMLDACRAELDVVTIPTPIPLHAPMHQACVERGLAVYLEKPPTLDYAELERMIAVDLKARRQTVVAFNFIVERERQALKRRMVAGEFGAVKRVTAFATWPRNTAYFTRSDWAGRLWMNDRVVLDSCIGNAMAHQVHNALFWCGAEDPWAWGQVERVSAELYRAHAIEGLDTAFLVVDTRQQIPLYIGMTHACSGTGSQEECVVCENAVIRYHLYNSGPGGALYTLAWKDGRVEHGPVSQRDPLPENFLAYAAYVRGDQPRPTTTLVDSRPFVHLNDLAYLAARHITTIGADHVCPAADGFLDVTGLREAIRVFINSGQLPGTQHLPWAQAGGTATPAALPELTAVIQAMARSATPPA